MPRKPITVNREQTADDWEELVIEDDNKQKERKQYLDFINWDQGVVAEGYYAGIFESKKGSKFGLLIKFNYEDEELPAYAFPITTKLKKALEKLDDFVFHPVRIECKNIIELDEGKKMYEFSIKTKKTEKIDETIILMYLPFTPKFYKGGNII